MHSTKKNTKFSQKIKVFLIEIYIEILTDLGVDWEFFMSKIINNENSFLQSVKNSFNCFFSMKREAG